MYYYMEQLINDRITEHFIQIENLNNINKKKGETNSQLKENIDKIKTEVEEYNIYKCLQTKCLCDNTNCNNEERVMYKQLREKRLHQNNRQSQSTTGPDMCMSDYEVLLSNVIMNMNEEIQMLKARG